MWLPTTLKRQLQWRKAGRMSKQSRGNHRVNVTRTAETTQIRSDALSLCLLVGLSLRLTYVWFPVVRSFILFLCLLT